jgi:hypothetical protein
MIYEYLRRRVTASRVIGFDKLNLSVGFRPTAHDIFAPFYLPLVCDHYDYIFAKVRLDKRSVKIARRAPRSPIAHFPENRICDFPKSVTSMTRPALRATVRVRPGFSPVAFTTANVAISLSQIVGQTRLIICKITISPDCSGHEIT